MNATRRPPKSPKARRTSWFELAWFDATVLRPRVWIGIAVSALVLVLGIVAFAISPPTGLFFLIVAIAGLAWSAFGVLGSIHRRADLRETRSPTLEKLIAETKPGLSPPDGEIVPVDPLRDAYLSSRSVDAWLRSGPTVRVRIDSGARTKRIEHLRQMRDKSRRLLQAQVRASKGKMFHNDAKVCLATDLRPGREEVAIWKGSYFISFLTNELTNTRFEPIGETHPRPVSDPDEEFRRYVVDPERRLRSLDDTVLANHMGGNTLAVTSDGLLALWRQSGKAKFSEGLLAPTGSGSLDWEDAEGSEDLIQIVTRGMDRELLEESTKRRTRIAPEWIGETRVIGFFRWIGRGGLPGFTAVTRLTVPRSELYPNSGEVDDPGDVTTVWPAHDLDALNDSATTLLTEYEHVLSLPLVACLRSLQDAIAHDPDVIADLLPGA